MRLYGKPLLNPQYPFAHSNPQYPFAHSANKAKTALLRAKKPSLEGLLGAKWLPMSLNIVPISSTSPNFPLFVPTLLRFPFFFMDLLGNLLLAAPGSCWPWAHVPYPLSLLRCFVCPVVRDCGGTDLFSPLYGAGSIKAIACMV